MRIWFLGLTLGSTGCGVPLEGSVVGGCINGVDDDGNGSVDCADASCARAPDCTQSAESDTGEALPTAASEDGGGEGEDEDPPTSDGDASDTGGSEVLDPACNQNSLRVTLPDGQGSADFDAFIWVADGDELVVAGQQTGGEDGCAAVTDIASQPGYLLELDIVGRPSAGEEFSVVFDANDPLQAEVRFENLGTSIAEVSTGEGTLTVDAFDVDATLRVSGFATTLNGGSVISEGTFVACPCTVVPE